MATARDLPENVIGVLADCGYTSPKDIIKKVISVDMHLPADLAYPFVQLGARLFGHFNIDELTPIDAVRNTKIPILLIHGDADDFVPCEMSEKMAMDAVALGVDLRFLKFENAPHAMSYLENTEEYGRAAREFIQEVLERNKENV